MQNSFEYASFFPQARARRRNITLIIGPTNSGKTYHAFQRLKAAKSGVFLAPLRLLALEGQETLTELGCRTSLVTGEEQDLVDDATHTSMTVEMLDYSTAVDTIVIDEVQMLSDPSRGWAWTQAIFGAPCQDLILCGSPEAEPTVMALAKHLGETVEVMTTERKTPLEYFDYDGGLAKVPRSAAVVAFSRRDVLTIKRILEQRGRTVSVVYGNLSPEVRRVEARRFRSGETEVLVATDAIAMGLNLPIETVLFSTLRKFDGEEARQLTAPEIRQIAGRAGRFGIFDVGKVGVIDGSRGDNMYLRKVMETPPSAAGKSEPVMINPSQEHVEELAEALNTDQLAKILKYFVRRITFEEPWLVPAVSKDMIYLAERADSSELALSDKLVWSKAPVKLRSHGSLNDYMTFLEHAHIDEPASIPERIRRGLRGGSRMHLNTLEEMVKSLDLYLWLARHYPALFPEQGEAVIMRRDLDAQILDSLQYIRERKQKGGARRRKGGGSGGGHSNNRGGGAGGRRRR